jgi:cell division protein FtsB
MYCKGRLAQGCDPDILETADQGSQFSFSSGGSANLCGERAGLNRQEVASMGRLLIGGLIVAMIAALLFYFYSSSYRTRLEEQTQQVSQLNDQLLKAQNENDQLKAELAKVQAEQTILAAQNDEMRKAIGEFKATGKMPVIPPPAK